MFRWTIDRCIKLGFSLAFALLAAVPLVVYSNKEKLLESNRQVAHTWEVIATLEATLRSLADAETFERGFVITGDESYVAPFEATCFQTRNLVAKLQNLTTDNVAQQRRLQGVKPLVQAKFKLMDEVIAARRKTGFDSSADIVSTGKGKRIMDEIRTLATGMFREEEALLALRNEQLGTTLSEGIKIFAVVMGLNMLTMGFSLFMVNRYIRHRRRTERELEEAKDTAEGANVAKSAFLANMSHEIRTPMTAIVGYADLLLEPGQTQSDKLDNLQTIRRNARHLLQLINDILDVSKIEAGKMKVESIPSDLPQLLGDVVSLMRPRALEKMIDFKLSFGSSVPKLMTTDPLRLKQILVNLLGNAIKFTEQGKVELAVSCAVNEGRATMKFDVIDTGIGITDAQMAKLFQPFNQADDSTTRRFGGSGLGLTISLRLAKLLGGTMEARSVHQKGSTFTVTLDGGAVQAHEMIEQPDESLLAGTSSGSVLNDKVITLQARILLAEDGRDNQRLISTHLRRANAEVVIAENGRIAVDLATTQRFDVILMDMQMPEMDGYAASSELRRRGLTLPIIALTAHAMSDDRAKCLSAGCTDYLTKPVDKELLLATVRSYLGKTAREALRSTYADDNDMKPIIEEFIAGLPQQVKEIENLLGARDLPSLKRVVHQLKGCGGGYGFQAVTELAARAEKQIIDSAPLHAVESQITELIDLIRSIEGFNDQQPAISEAVTS